MILSEIFYELEAWLIKQGKDPVDLLDNFFKQNNKEYCSRVIKAREISIEEAYKAWMDYSGIVNQVVNNIKEIRNNNV